MGTIQALESIPRRLADAGGRQAASMNTGVLCAHSGRMTVCDKQVPLSLAADPPWRTGWLVGRRREPDISGGFAQIKDELAFGNR